MSRRNWNAKGERESRGIPGSQVDKLDRNGDLFFLQSLRPCCVQDDGRLGSSSFIFPGCYVHLMPGIVIKFGNDNLMQDF